MSKKLSEMTVAELEAKLETVAFPAEYPGFDENGNRKSKVGEKTGLPIVDENGFDYWNYSDALEQAEKRERAAKRQAQLNSSEGKAEVAEMRRFNDRMENLASDWDY